MKTPFLTFWLLLSAAYGALAQPSQQSRAELPFRNDFTQYEVLPQPDSTVFLLTHEDFVRRNAEPFQLFKFSQELTLLWQRPLQLPRGIKYLKLTSEKHILFLLFAGARKDEYVLLRVNTQTSEQTQTTHLLPESINFTFTGLEVLQGNLFMTGLQNDRLTLLHLDPERGELWKLPAIYDLSSALTSFQSDTLARRLEVVLAESNGLKSRLQIKRLAPDGHLFSTNFLQSPEHNYLMGSLTPGDSSRKLIAGTYSLRDLRYPQGFFTGPFLPANGNGQSVQFHDFTTFTHFFDYMRPGRQEKVRRKLARFRVSRKTYFLRQRFLMHEMYPYQDGFILAGEQYYPQYEGEGASNRVFSGYGFSQVVAAAFNGQGDLIWENSFPLKNIQQFDLKQIAAAGVSGSQFIICYLYEGAIYFKVVSGNEYSSNELKCNALPVLPGDKVLNTDLDGIKHWYQNHFLVFGEQKIRGSAGTRTVFFLNKLSF